MSVTITGAESVIAALEQLSTEITAKIMPEFKSAADGTLVEAQDRCPYDENHKGSDPHLRDTGRVEAIDGGYSVTFGDESGDYGYSWYVETGHKTRSGGFVAAQPYLMPSFEQNAEELQIMLKEIL